ncbi:MAG: NAD(P)H-hydrate dehydratase [Candidatus Margulisbacteria bacterium]|nr:NAD(P)H-hydrate dehydratase [Candidatus Margulisiibacteriota bacterium]
MSKNNITPAEIKKLFPKRPPDSHKGDFGKVFILAGSEGMLGAAILCGRGALRIGAGLVYLGCPLKARDTVNCATPEIIVVGGDKAADYLTAAQKADAIAVGPGLGWRRDIARDMLFKLSDEKFSGPVVVDADGLNAFIGDISALEKLQLKLVLTPHPGEMARLLGQKSAEIQKNREKTAAETAKLLKCTVVLKGYRTVVADQGGALYINETGNPGLATGGVGDVLTGMIVGLAARGIPAFEAAAAAVYLHGLAGDLAAKEKGEYGLIASDLIEKIPNAIQ